MPSTVDVSPNVLIERLARFFKENVGEITPPAWALFAKTGSHKERPPSNRDWWYTRCASIMRKLYLHGPIGVSRLRVGYGGRLRHGTHIEHSRPAGGSAIREPLQQLEKAGYVTTEAKKGRKLTSEGVSLLNRLAVEVMKASKKEEQ